VEKLVLTLEGGDEGPDLAAEEEVNSPVGLVTAIWNHAPKMEKAFAKEGIQWPISWPISKQCSENLKRKSGEKGGWSESPWFHNQRGGAGALLERRRGR